jgi:hypothetical protein
MASARSPGKVRTSRRGPQYTFARGGAARRHKGRCHPKDDARYGAENPRCSRRPRGAEQRSNHGDEVDGRPAARAHYPNRDRRCAPGKAATAIGRASYLYHRRCINPRFARGSRGTIRTAHFRPSRPNWRRLAASPHVIRFIEPMYALASNDLPKGDEWLYEVKLPGHFFRRGNQDLAALAGTPRFRGPGLLGSPLALSVGFLLAAARRREWIAQARIVAYRGTLGRMVGILILIRYSRQRGQDR